MKDRMSCIVDEQDRTSCIVDNCSSEYEDDLMECGDFLDLMGLTKQLEGGEVDIYMMAERIASLLGRSNPEEEDDLSSSEDDHDDDLDHDHDASPCVGVTADNSRVSWNEHNLLLAGYTNCMDEAIRFLVEEEQYAVEHPIVQGLKQHLVSQQERVLEEAARGTTTDANRPAHAQRVDSCAIRPPSI